MTLAAVVVQHTGNPVVIVAPSALVKLPYMTSAVVLFAVALCIVVPPRRRLYEGRREVVCLCGKDVALHRDVAVVGRSRCIHVEFDLHRAGVVLAVDVNADDIPAREHVERRFVDPVYLRRAGHFSVVPFLAEGVLVDGEIAVGHTVTPSLMGLRQP